MTDEKKLFLLVPPGEYTQHMPNMGDRALQEGMRILWQACHGGPVVHDEWNSFPNLTWEKLSAGGRIPPERFDSMLERCRARAGRPTPVNSALSRLLFGPLFSWLPVWPVLDRMARRNTGQSGREAVAPRIFPGLAARNFAEKMAGCDAVAMNAGGLIADHLFHYLPGRIFALHAAVRAGLPTAIVNYSFAVSKPHLLEWVAPVMRSVTLHAVRESVSREKLLDIGVDPGRIIVSRDSAFAVPAPPETKPAAGAPTIGLQIRGDRRQDIAAWTDLAGELRARYNARIIYLVGCRKYDPPVAAELKKRAALDFVHIPDSPQELKTAIGECHALITDRYHGIVFATQAGTPFVPLASTTHKTKGLLDDLGYPLAAHPQLEREHIGAVIADIESCLAGRDALSASLREHAETFRTRLLQDYREIVRRLRDNSDAKITDKEG